MVNKIKLRITCFLMLYSIAACFAQPAAQLQDTTPVASPAVAPVAGSSDKYVQRQFDQGFQEKYQDSDFEYERKSKGVSQWERFKAWLYDLITDIFNFGDKTTKTSIFIILIRVLACIIILFVVYMIVRAILNKEGMWIFGRSRKNVSVQDTIAENIHEMDFSSLVAETKTKADYRLAVRYYFLWLLKKLSAREIIDWNYEKTNRDYLYEIKDSRLREDFEYLAYLYDYSWYGEFPLDEQDFRKAESAFQKTFNTL